MIELKIAAATTDVSWLEWILQLTGIVIWPLTIIAVVYGFRAPISVLIKNIIKLSVPGAEVEFRQVLESAEKSIAEQAADTDENAPTVDAQDIGELEEQDKLENNKPSVLDGNKAIRSKVLEALQNPAKAIQDSWFDVYTILLKLNRDINNKRGVPNVKRAKHPSSDFVIRKLLSYSVIKESTASLLFELDKLRNISAAQGAEFVTEGDAIRFFNLTQAAMSDLSKASVEHIKIPSNRTGNQGRGRGQ